MTATELRPIVTEVRDTAGRVFLHVLEQAFLPSIDDKWPELTVANRAVLAQEVGDVLVGLGQAMTRAGSIARAEED